MLHVVIYCSYLMALSSRLKTSDVAVMTVSTFSSFIFLLKLVGVMFGVIRDRFATLASSFVGVCLLEKETFRRAGGPLSAFALAFGFLVFPHIINVSYDYVTTRLQSG